MPISRNNSKINKCKITRGPWNTWFLGRKKRCSLKFKLLLLYIWNYLVQCWYNDSKLKTMHHQGPCTLILHASRMPCTPCAHIKYVKFKLKSHDKKERYLQIFIRLSWFSRIPNTSFFAHRHDWSGQWKGSISSHRGLKSERKCNLESYTVCIKG